MYGDGIKCRFLQFFSVGEEIYILICFIELYFYVYMYFSEFDDMEFLVKSFKEKVKRFRFKKENIDFQEEN